MFHPPKGNSNEAFVNLFKISAIAICLAFSTGAMAQSMSKDQYKSGTDGIAAEYKSARAACGSLSGNANGLCRAEASGKEKVAKAELRAKYQPSEDASYRVRVARADADHSVAREKCDDQTGDVKDVCVRQAKDAAVAAKAQARARMTNANANAKENAPATSDGANQKAEKGAGARKD
jgi:hypothetical protein